MDKMKTHTLTIENSIEKKKAQVEKLNKDILELQKDLETQDFQTFNYKGKEIRVYKWEDKRYGDFPMPKGFDWCECQDFIDLINDKKIELEKHPIYYFTKNIFKLNLGDYPLSRLYLNRIKR